MNPRIAASDVAIVDSSAVRALGSEKPNTFGNGLGLSHPTATKTANPSTAGLFQANDVTSLHARHIAAPVRRTMPTMKGNHATTDNCSSCDQFVEEFFESTISAPSLGGGVGKSSLLIAVKLF